MHDAGWKDNDFSVWDMFDIYEEMVRGASTEHILIDMSAHEGKVEGLPFNLDFTVSYITQLNMVSIVRLK